MITETSQAAPTRLVGVDGLRALAAMFVFVQHVWRFGSPDGFSPDIGPFDSVLSHFRVGVTLFFVLSGFLLYRPFVAAIRDARPLPRFRSYFRSRALRILPAYWVILFATAFLLQTFLQRESVSHEDYRSPHDLGQLFGAIVFVQNYVPSWLQAGIGTAWSLNVEIVFYLVLPLLVLLAGALASRARTSRGRWLSLLAPVFVLLVVGASGKIAARFVDGVGPSPGFDGDWHSVIARSFWFHADLFAVGLTLALVSVAAERRPEVLPRRWRLGAGLAMVAVGGAALATSYLYDLLTAVGCGLLVALVVLPHARDARGPRLSRLFEARPLVCVGLASYSIFLWHEPVIHFLRVRGVTSSGGLGYLMNLVLVAIVTGALATLTYLYVERPALRLKTRRGSDVDLAAAQQHAAP